MGTTLEDLMERLSMLEETYLVELLQLRSSDIVQRFADEIEEIQDELWGEFEELDNDESE